LHPFGGLAEIGDTVDLNATTTPTWVGDTHDLDWIADESYDPVILDPLLGRGRVMAVFDAPAEAGTVYRRGCACVPYGLPCLRLSPPAATPAGRNQALPPDCGADANRSRTACLLRF
jgi:hypothetical protein